MPASHLRLPRHLIPTLMLLAVGEPGTAAPAEAVGRLERFGLVEEGRITPHGRTLVEIMTEATLVASMECLTADLPHRSTIWARDGQAVWGRPAQQDVFELRRIGAIEIPLLLAQIADVGRRPLPPFSGSVSVPVDALRAAAGGDFDQETAFGILVAAGVEPSWADRLLIAYEHRRMEWTISSVWTDGDGAHGVAEATVLDAGPAGYWHVSAGEGVRSFAVGSLESVMRTIRRCVPAWCAAPA